MINNVTMMQYFEWYLPADAALWRKVKQEASILSHAGITAVWLPPAYKGAGGLNEVGYAVYDTYDLGEFNQKGSIPTKYGTKEEYLQAIRALQENHIQVYADIVLNHRIGADRTEEIAATAYSSSNRNEPVSAKEKIVAWTQFNFEGRHNHYSDFRWHYNHFDGTDWDQNKQKKAVYKFEGKEWEKGVDAENGNYDYLMGADLDFSNQEVVDELYKWGKWYLETTGVDGMRIDAVKHIGTSFFRDWIPAMSAETGKNLFAVGEYWHKSKNALLSYIDKTNGVMSVFDVPLHFNLHNASRSGGNYDMSQLLEGALVSDYPDKAMTFVDNHDTQLGQALESWVDGWFKPIAYAVILLRAGGCPCVFYGDYYGISNNGIQPVGDMLHLLIKSRRDFAYGTQHDYFDNFNVVGWTREGDDAHEHSGMAVLLSDGIGGSKSMYIGNKFAGCEFIDLTGHKKESIFIDENGCGIFTVEGGSVSVWVKTEAKKLNEKVI